jgi:hypothetical protein
MGFLQRLAALFGGRPPQADTRFLPLYVHSRRCNEPIAGRLDLLNEVSAAEDGAEGAVWYARKVFHTSGRGRCFDQVEVELWLDGSKQILRKEVTGGLWLERDEYDRLLQAQASTLEDDTPGGGSASDIDESEKPGGTMNAR